MPPPNRRVAAPDPQPSGSSKDDLPHLIAGVSGPAAGADIVALGSGKVVKLAGPGARLGARTIDTLIGIILAVTIGFLDAMAIWCVYEVVLTAVMGKTVGKMLVRIKVIRADSGGVPGVGKSIGRWIIFCVMPVIGPIWLLWDRNRQGLYDKAAGTVVIKPS